MSADLQTRLLRVLAEKEFYRVGGQTPIQVDVRVVAATNKDLSEAVRKGEFREDLFHRLNVIHIQAPPLRERREDISLLLRHFLNEAAKELQVEPKQLTTDAIMLLESFDWPGNVRQLINACRRLTITAPGTEIQVEDVPVDLGGSSVRGNSQSAWITALAEWAEGQIDKESGKPLLQIAVPEFERALIRTALARANGRRQDAAKMLGLGRNTLTRKIRELGIDV
jgi:two-component system nitrogen regulation response regulator GlnG